MTSTQLITATDLEAMGSDAWFELIHGVLHEMSPSSTDSSAIGLRIGGLLAAYVYEHKLGIATGENGGYILERDPDTVVAPDAGFIREDRRSLNRSRRGYFPGIPDLAIEVISPTDEPADIRRKKTLYERAGVPLVWWIDPETRTATVHVLGQPVRHLSESDSLDGESVILGFSVPLGTLFDL